MAGRTLMLLNPVGRKKRRRRVNPLKKGSAAARKAGQKAARTRAAKKRKRVQAGKKAWATRMKNAAAKKRKKPAAKRKKGGRKTMAKMTKAKRRAAALKGWRNRRRGPGGKRGTKARRKGKYHRPRVYRAKSGRWYRKKPGSRGKSYTFPKPTRLNPRRKKYRRTYRRKPVKYQRKYRRNPLPSFRKLTDPKTMINGIKLGASVLGGYAIINTFDTQISSKIAAKVLPNSSEGQFWLSTILNAMGTVVISGLFRGTSSKMADAIMAGGFFVVTKDIVMKVMPAAANLIEGGGLSGFTQVGMRGFAQAGQRSASPGFGALEYDGM